MIRLFARNTFGILAASATALLLAGCGDEPGDYPPIDSEQTGYRGVGMVQHTNPRMEEIKRKINEAPDPLYPPVGDGGPLAKDVYQNVQVLGDLTEGQFTRLMAHITEWVVPKEGLPEDQQGCNYCHNPNNLADDSVYTKIVSRKMIQMTRDINGNWQDHVNQNGEGAGVTCYTCHRGNGVPNKYWFKTPEDPPSMVGWDGGQNHPHPQINYASLPEDPFSLYLLEDNNARVVSDTALPTGNPKNIKDTEHTYAMMIHMSQGLGVNCTYCHNSRSVAEWNRAPEGPDADYGKRPDALYGSQNRPQRATAWYGIQMAKDANNEWMAPLASVIPSDPSEWMGNNLGPRLGPLGDVGKINCTTCHNNVYKPLYGAKMLKDHPELWGGGDYSADSDGTTASADGMSAAGGGQ